MRNTLRRAVRLRTLAGLFFCTLLSMSLVAQAPPSQDTFVSSATPKVNFGSSIALVVSPGSTSYIQFNLSGIPAGAIVSKATLRLYVDAVATKGSFDVYQLNSAWSENALTYNTPAPALGASATGGHPVSVGAGSMNQFLLIERLGIARRWLWKVRLAWRAAPLARTSYVEGNPAWHAICAGVRDGFVSRFGKRTDRPAVFSSRLLVGLGHLQRLSGSIAGEPHP